MNQLTRENNYENNYTYCYEYDLAGNITKKTKYALNNLNQVLDTINYTYGSSTNWGDLLTNYDGTAITYDAIGTPENWRNAADMEWEGRTLTSLAPPDIGSTNSFYERTLTFEYNSKIELI